MCANDARIADSAHRVLFKFSSESTELYTHIHTHRNTHFCMYISGFKLLFSALDPQISILQGAISEEHKGQSHSVRSSRETWTNTQSHTKSSEM